MWCELVVSVDFVEFSFQMVDFKFLGRFIYCLIKNVEDYMQQILWC